MKSRSRSLGLAFVSLVLSSCNSNSDSGPGYCAPTTLSQTAHTTGSAKVFNPDPIVASGNPNLSPGALNLDDYRTSVTLNHLGGRGVLEGQYVEVRDGLSCQEWFGAFDQRNLFTYSHSDGHFQEAMAYYFGDQYRSALDAIGYLRPTAPVRIVAHCMVQDNAYFTKARDSSGAVIDKVCLGDSAMTPGAFYGDDGIVTVHELQHATTTDLYTNSQVTQNLNQFWYDEAGALNEAISDFMGLIYTAPLLPGTLDPQEFSRWALDKFYPNSRGTRGAHRCPEYDSAFATGCSNFPNFSSDTNTVSYVYPDGMGWPYANNSAGPDPVRSIYKTYRSQEEIHNGGILLEGALWDVYESLKGAHDPTTAQSLSMKLVLEAIRHLPKPTAQSLSPVTFRSYASAIMSSMTLLGFSGADQAAVSQALTARGLLGGTLLTAGWAQKGAGMAVTPGMKIEDNFALLKDWLSAMGSNPALVTQGIETGLNSLPDPGEVVALWFDIADVAAVSAGAVRVTVSSPDPDITFLDGMTNVGPISTSSAQVLYGKINGTNVTAALNGTQYPTGAGNSYFKTDPYFSHNWQTAIFAKISGTAAHGKVVNLQVEALPSNGDATVITFPVTIN